MTKNYHTANFVEQFKGAHKSLNPDLSTALYATERRFYVKTETLANDIEKDVLFYGRIMILCRCVTAPIYYL